MQYVKNCRSFLLSQEIDLKIQMRSLVGFSRHSVLGDEHE